MQTENLRRRHLHWEGLKLFYSEALLVELIAHEKHENHYYLKFFWREEETPEFFNLTNAKENAVVYSLQRLSAEPSVPLLMRLNELRVPIQPELPKIAVRGCNG